MLCLQTGNGILGSNKALQEENVLGAQRILKVTIPEESPMTT